jgi:hypothetical protein
MGSKPEQVIRRDGTTVWTNKGTYHETKVVSAESNDSKTKDGVVVSTPRGDWEVEIIDGTHLKIKNADFPNSNWTSAFHIQQVDPDMMAQLKIKGLLKDNGRFFNTDAYEPTAPKNIAAAKKMSVAQGKAATGDKKNKGK